MAAVAIKTFDAMEAPEWPGPRSKPPVEIDPQIIDAPPVPPEFLHHAEFIVPKLRAVTAPTIGAPYPEPPPQPPRPTVRLVEAEDVRLSAEEEAWFTAQSPISASDSVITYEVDAAKIRRKQPKTWLTALIGLTLLTGAWTSIAWILLRTL